MHRFRRANSTRRLSASQIISSCFSDKAVANALLNTLYFTVVEVAASSLLGLLVALLLNHPMGRWSGYRVMLLLPWAIAPVANAVLWKWIYHSNYGILNAILLQLGIIDSNVTWLGDPFRRAQHDPAGRYLEIDAVHRNPAACGLAEHSEERSIALRASTAPISWQSFRYVTLPSLKTAIAIAVILQTIWSLRVFDLIFVLTKGGPADGTVVMNFLAYRVTFNFLKFGYGAAIANVIFITSLILAIVYVRLMRPGARR